MLSFTFFLTSLASLASVQASNNTQVSNSTDCAVLHAGFPQIPETGCCAYEEDDPENNWANKTNLGIYCDVRMQPASTVPLGRIKFIAINKQGLEGFIPEDIDKLTYMDWFSVYDNNLVGTIPESICNLPLLRRFWVALNPGFHGYIPKCLPKLVKMKSLEFADTQMRGTIPYNLAGMTVLDQLYLSYDGNGHKFTGVLPNLDSLPVREFFAYDVPGYKYPFIGVFPNITRVSETYGAGTLKACGVIPSKLCRYPDIPVSAYEAAEYGCNAGQLPICSEQDFATIAEAQRRAADPELSAIDEAALFASYAQDIVDEQAVVDAEIARVAALKELERLADEEAQARIDAADAAVEEARLLALAEALAQTSAARPAFTPAILVVVILVLAVL